MTNYNCENSIISRVEDRLSLDNNKMQTISILFKKEIIATSHVVVFCAFVSHYSVNKGAEDINITFLVKLKLISIF